MLRFSKGHYFGIAILICSIGLLQLFIYWFNNQNLFSQLIQANSYAQIKQLLKSEK